jgi:hypothetical protein
MPTERLPLLVEVVPIFADRGCSVHIYSIKYSLAFCFKYYLMFSPISGYGTLQIFGIGITLYNTSYDM